MGATATYAADLKSVRDAAARIAPHAHRTPVVTCSALDERAGRKLFLKCELFQKTGSFKFRGACNAVMNLSDDQARRGVVTHSSGNHAQALALAARMREIPAHIIMPETALAVKRHAVEGYGANIYLCPPTEQSRQTLAEEVQARTGAVMILPCDNPDIIAGQGTATLELLEEVPDLNAVIAPIGGGGLMSGTSITARAMDPRIRIFAAEPEGADDVARSLAQGELIKQTDPRTICDGLLVSLGDLTWPIVRDHVERVVTFSDEEVIAAMRLAWQRAKLPVEPSGAASLAAVLSETFRSLDGMERVGVILSGGNADLDRLPW